MFLSILKFLLGKFARKTIFAHVEDLAAESSVFTVTFFHTLFVSICLNHATSLAAVVVLLTVDVAHILVFHGTSGEKFESADAGSGKKTP